MVRTVPVDVVHLQLHIVAARGERQVVEVVRAGVEVDLLQQGSVAQHVHRRIVLQDQLLIAGQRGDAVGLEVLALPHEADTRQVDRALVAARQRGELAQREPQEETWQVVDQARIAPLEAGTAPLPRWWDPSRFSAAKSVSSTRWP